MYGEPIAREPLSLRSCGNQKSQVDGFLDGRGFGGVECVGCMGFAWDSEDIGGGVPTRERFGAMDGGERAGVLKKNGKRMGEAGEKSYICKKKSR